jgi:hypothetical protein
VLALIRGGSGAEHWTAAAAEPSIFRHGWGGQNGEFFWWLCVDGSWLAFLAFKKMAVGKLGKFKLKYQGKHVILI